MMPGVGHGSKAVGRSRRQKGVRGIDGQNPPAMVPLLMKHMNPNLSSLESVAQLGTDPTIRPEVQRR